MERLFLRLISIIILTLFIFKTMQNEFAKLPGQEEHPLPAKPTLEEDDSCESSKKTCFKWLCSNLERIVSILVIVYFLVLIVRLVALDDAFITLVKPQTSPREYNSLQLEKTIDLSDLESVLDSAKTKGKLTLASEDGFLENGQTQAQKRLLEPSTQGIQTKKKASSKGSSQKTAKITGNKHASTEEGEDYRIALQEVQAEKRAKQTAGKYSLFEQIYSQMDENLHKTVRSISKEERQPIIAQYFKDKEDQRYIEELLKENYKYLPQRSKADTAYLQLVRENYDLSSNEESSTPMCVILSTHNNAFGGQIIRTLNSIFNQQHPNFSVMIADADSSDNTLTTINKYLDEHKDLKKKTKVLALESKSQAFAVVSAGKTCKEGSLVVMLDGNTQLIGKEALNILDAVYRISNPVVLYPSHYSLDAATQALSLFNAKDYDESQVFMLSYRHTPAKYGRILACKAATMQNILPQHIQHNGKYFEFTGIDAIAVSLLELSCGRTKVVDEVMGLSGWDSSVVEAEKEGRKHETQLLSMKSKFDVC